MAKGLRRTLKLLFLNSVDIPSLTFVHCKRIVSCQVGCGRDHFHSSSRSAVKLQGHRSAHDSVLHPGVLTSLFCTGGT